MMDPAIAGLRASSRLKEWPWPRHELGPDDYFTVQQVYRVLVSTIASAWMTRRLQAVFYRVG